jgi:hypothetical protein
MLSSRERDPKGSRSSCFRRRDHRLIELPHLVVDVVIARDHSVRRRNRSMLAKPLERDRGTTFVLLETMNATAILITSLI